jgi:hypothetical protein
VSIIDKKTKRFLQMRWGKFQQLISGVIFYPFKAFNEKFQEHKVGTSVMSLLLVAFSLVLIVTFWRSSWSPFIVPWEGTVVNKEIRSSTAGPNQISNYVLKVERGEKETSDHIVGKQTYIDTTVNDKVHKPMFYQRVLRENESRSASHQLQAILFSFVGLLLFLFGLICGNSFIAIIFVSLFLHEPKKHKNRSKKK